MRKCVVCFTDINPKRENIVTCSHKCKRQHDMNQAKQKRINQRRKKAYPNLVLLRKTCQECGIVFETTTKTQITCQNQECKRLAQNKRQAKISEKKRKVLQESRPKPTMVLCKCPMCGVGHYVEMMPSNIMPRVFCPEHKLLAASRSSCGIYQADNRCYAV